MGIFDRFRFSGKQLRDNGTTATDAHRETALRLIDEGNAFEETGQLEQAASRYDAAIAKAPDLARAHMNRGNILLARGDAEGALNSYQTALKLEPDYAAAHYNLGNALVNLNNHEAACAAYENAIELQPDSVDAHFARGCSLEDLGRHEEAVASYRRALAISPDYGQVHANLGKTLIALGQTDAGIENLQRAAELMPDDIQTLFILGLVQESRGQLQAARSSLSRVQAAWPQNVEVNVHLGDTCLELGETNDAIACYRRVLDTHPDNATAHNNLGNVYFRLGLYDDAVACYRRAAELQPDNAGIHCNLGSILKDLGLTTEGIEHLRRSLEIDPENATTRSNLLFILHLLEDVPQHTLLEEARTFGEIVSRKVTADTSWKNTPLPERRLRIGFVSGDLCFHPVGFFLEGILRAITANTSGNLEVFAYMTAFRADSVSESIRKLCRQWRDVFGLSDNDAARLIKEDQIDILIDLSGHSANNRLPLLACKPAPVQASWLGYFDTTGVTAIDYLIADPWTLPESEDIYFTETIWRLPETRLCFTPPGFNVTIRPLPALSEGQITFGCFNSLNKMGDSVVTLWARVLAAVPNSRLYLKARQLYQPLVRDSIIERFGQHGIDPARLILEGPDTRANYLAAYNRVDIALDPFPYPGGTTTAEALWMGVPVLTLAGRHFLSRQGIGLLMNAGLPEWVAADHDDYVARAVAHASDLEELAALRSRLRPHVLASPVYDAPSFARHFEAALRAMWRKYCDQQSPHSSSTPKQR